MFVALVPCCKLMKVNYYQTQILQTGICLHILHEWKQTFTLPTRSNLLKHTFNSIYKESTFLMI